MRTMEAVSDREVQEEIMRVINAEPEVGPADISVNVHSGVATLTGFVHSYYAKLAAEQVTKQVPGVEGLANDIQVKLGNDASDPEIVRECVRALREDRVASGARLTVTVRDGLVILEGRVQNYRQKRAAEDAVMTVPGSKGVISRLEICPSCC